MRDPNAWDCSGLVAWAFAQQGVGDGEIYFASPARLLGIAPSTAWKRIAQGCIPVVRLGRRTLISRAAIERLVASGEVQAHR